MPYLKRIICLANSNKNGGTCIAGREMLLGGQYGCWIRPVSSRSTAEISFMESLYPNNESPKLLDVIDLYLSKPSPHNHQTENHEIDPNKPWIKRGKLAWNEVPRLVDRPAALWPGTEPCPANNCIGQLEATACTDSLFLVRVDRLIVSSQLAFRSGAARQTYKAKFTYNGTDYCLTLTDPAAIAVLSNTGLRQYHVDNVYLTVSLTEPYAADNNRCHKLVAAVVSRPSL